jgi:hypothetical protein
MPATEDYKRDLVIDKGGNQPLVLGTYVYKKSR